jgi:hypothetical protein
MTDEEIERVTADVRRFRHRRRIPLLIALAVAAVPLYRLCGVWWTPPLVSLLVLGWSEYSWRPGGWAFRMRVNRWVEDPARWQRERTGYL